MPDAALHHELGVAPSIERTYEDPGLGFKAFVVIDSLSSGRANGGVRIKPDVTLEEIGRLARVMTWKYRFAGVPFGGAKAGIVGPEDLTRGEKARRLTWFGEAASDLIDSGVFGIGPDLGTDSDLIEELLTNRQLLKGRRRFPRRFRGSGYYTAMTTLEACSAALEIQGETLRGKSVAIEGFGSVGSNLARLLSGRRATLVGISTSSGALFRPQGLDVAAILESREPLEGDARASLIAKEELLELDVDVLFLCGPGGTIDGRNVNEVQARVIAPGANSAYGLEAATLLHERGRIAIPCFVSNCGGVVAAALRMSQVPEWAIERLLRKTYRRRVESFLRLARDRAEPPMELALARLPPLPGSSEGPDSRGRFVTGLARSLVRSRLTPAPLIGMAAYAYFLRRLAVLRHQ